MICFAWWNLFVLQIYQSDDFNVNLLYCSCKKLALKQDSAHFVLCPKQGNKIEGQVFKCSVAHLYPNTGRVPPPPPPRDWNVPTWLVSVFCVCVSVSSTLRCRLILKFLSLLASFCSTSCWCADSLEERVTRSVLEYRVHCFLRVIFVVT